MRFEDSKVVISAGRGMVEKENLEMIETLANKLNAAIYYENLPNLENKNVFILEPMLATGGSLSFAIDKVKEHSPKSIIALTLVTMRILHIF